MRHIRVHVTQRCITPNCRAGETHKWSPPFIKGHGSVFKRIIAPNESLNQANDKL